MTPLSLETTTRLKDRLIISASAGTGKTYSITDIAARWMIEADERPSSLLLTTFSRAAAAELKVELRKRLTEKLQAISDPLKPLEDVGLGATGLNREELRLRCIKILSELDDVTASTIHAFVANVSGTNDALAFASDDVVAQAVQEELMALTTMSAREKELADLLSSLKQGGSDDTIGGALKKLRNRLEPAVKRVLASGWKPGDGLGSILASPDGNAQATTNVADLIERCVLRAYTTKKTERLTTYDGIINDFAEKLRGEELPIVSALREKFRMVMIDEFQDTDLQQWEIFQRLFLQPLRSQPFEATKVVMVGDTKQAIYGFRGCNVAIFTARENEIREHPELGDIETLDTSFRSTRDLIHELNELFVTAEENGWHINIDAFGKSTGQYERLNAHEAGRPSDPVRAESRNLPAFEIRTPVPTVASEESSGNKRANDHSEYLECADIARVAKEIVRSGSFRADEICVISRTKRELTMVRRALADQGLKSVFLSVSNVFTSDAADQLRHLLWILEEPTNPSRTKSKEALWFDFSNHSMLDLARTLEDRGIHVVVDLLQSSKFFVNMLNDFEGDRNLTDLEHLIELTTDQFPFATDALRIRQWLEAEHATASRSTESDEGRRRIESDDLAIRLTTAHASKGLQWPVVLVRGLDRSDEGNARPGEIDWWSDAAGEHIVTRSIIGQASENETLLAKNFLEGELRRLAYVALTRAKSALVVWTGKYSGKRAPLGSLMNTVIAATADRPDAERLSSDQSLSEHASWKPRLRHIGDSIFLKQPDRQGTESTESDARNWATYVPAPRLDTATRRWSYSDLKFNTSIERPPTDELMESTLEAGVRDDDDTDDGTLDQPEPTSDPGAQVFGDYRGTKIGSAVHGVFELLVGAGEPTRDAIINATNVAFPKFGIPSTEGMFVDLFERLMHYPLGEALDGRSLADYAEQPERVVNEMRFTMELMPAGSDQARATDRLREIGSVAAELDPSGPFVKFFEAVHSSPWKYQRMVEGFLTGSLDVVLQTLGDKPRFVVVDYKTNGLKHTEDYLPESLYVEMAGAGYPLQALLYAVALHRFLAPRLSNYDPERHLGGALYYYVRGALSSDDPRAGLAHWNIPAALIVAASTLLSSPVLASETEAT